ncbi:MAG: UDP-N-acetylmuramate--L-alanine ligase [Phycisphaerae bacterium]|jgi:UDP-N-acetylmuramate--alanine ligase
MPEIVRIQGTKIAATHRYEVVRPVADKSLAGKKFHFIGAGGIGMSGLAKVLLANEAAVSGSDQMDSEVTHRLQKLGANIKIGHSAENLDGKPDAVVISAAVKEDNPELQKARAAGVKVYKYAEMLGEIMNRYDGIAIAGTHGKSTTSGWLAFVLERAGLKPNFVVGADVIQLGGNSGTGTGTIFVAEACEYDRSFLNLRPKFGAVLNIEPDHLDYYKDIDDITDAFADFARNVRQEGTLIVNGQDVNVKELLSRLGEATRYQTFGVEGESASNDKYDYCAKNLMLEDGVYSFDCFVRGYPLGRAQISLPGLHNVSNAMAVIALSSAAGVDTRLAMELLGDFEGVDRRLMRKAQVNGITVLDDYAHHPTEIKASLSAIRQRYNPARLFCVFQPHQYSRTRFLLDDFAESFKLADVTIVPEIYFVRDSELSKQEVNAQKLVERIRATGSEAVFIDGFAAICDYLAKNVGDGDLVVTMGAGDIWKVADEYIRRLGTDS